MSYEIEIKALLRTDKRAKEIRNKLMHLDKKCSAPISVNNQLNHYFVGKNLNKLIENLRPFLSSRSSKDLNRLSQKLSDYSVRTRNKDGEVFFVFKASIDGGSSANGVSRIEIEEKVPVSLNELDRLIYRSGFRYQAKWSRIREEYVCKGINITLDRNAGYGWVSEFERVVNSSNQVKSAEKSLRSIMRKLDVEELPQDRLQRMFDFYNKNWKKFYGTNRTFLRK